MQPKRHTGGAALVVDDDDRVRTVTCRALALHGMSTDEAADGEAGLHRALAAPYSVVLLDLQLPKLDGLAVLRRLRASRPGQRVVVFTCQSDAGVQAECRSAGAGGFLPKPFSLSELWTAVVADQAPAWSATENDAVAAGSK